MKTKKSKVLWLGMLAVTLVLAFGLVLTGCKKDSDDDDDGGSGDGLVITGVPSGDQGAFDIGIINSDPAIVAGGDEGDATLINSTTVRVLLYTAPGYTSRWTGSGTFAVTLQLSGQSPKVATNIPFSSGAGTVSYNSFVPVQQ